MYKIKVKQTGLGWHITLSKKYLCFWIPDTVSIIKRGYEYMVDEQINDWVKTFNIPQNRIILPKDLKNVN